MPIDLAKLFLKHFTSRTKLLKKSVIDHSVNLISEGTALMVKPVTTKHFEPFLASSNIKNTKDEKFYNLQKISNPEINIYPNPAQNELFLKISNLKSLPTKVQIFNTLGKRMTELNFDESTQGRLRFDLMSFYEGIYYLKIEQSGEAPITKVFTIVR